MFGKAFRKRLIYGLILSGETAKFCSAKLVNGAQGCEGTERGSKPRSCTYAVGCGMYKVFQVYAKRKLAAVR